MSGTLAVEARHLAIIQAILGQYLPPEAQVWAYGSRAGARPHHRGSDLDLMVKADAELGFHLLAVLGHEFSESLLPYRIDLHDWHDTSADFLARIRPTMVKLPLPEHVSAAQPGP